MKVNAIFIAALASTTSGISLVSNKHDSLAVPTWNTLERRGPTAFCDIAARKEIKEALNSVAIIASTARDQYSKHPEKAQQYFKLDGTRPDVKKTILKVLDIVYTEAHLPMGRVTIVCDQTQIKCPSGVNMYTEKNKIILCRRWWTGRSLERESPRCHKPSRATTLFQGYAEEVLRVKGQANSYEEVMKLKKPANLEDGATYAFFAQAIHWEELRGRGTCGTSPEMLFTSSPSAMSSMSNGRGTSRSSVFQA